MLIDHWPLLGLRLTSPGLELRLPSEEELGELADLAADGRVSQKLGYESDGIERVPVSVTGLSPCLPLFGLPDSDGS